VTDHFVRSHKATEDFLPDDMQALSEHGDDMSVTEEYSPSDSETEQEPLLQDPAGSHYPVTHLKCSFTKHIQMNV